MNIGTFIVMEREEALERAMAAQRARHAREQRGFGRGRRISREEALNRIAKTHPRSAWKILQGYRLGGRRPVPERRSH